MIYQTGILCSTLTQSYGFSYSSPFQLLQRLLFYCKLIYAYAILRARIHVFTYLCPLHLLPRLLYYCNLIYPHANLRARIHVFTYLCPLHLLPRLLFYCNLIYPYANLRACMYVFTYLCPFHFCSACFNCNVLTLAQPCEHACLWLLFVLFIVQMSQHFCMFAITVCPLYCSNEPTLLHILCLSVPYFKFCSSYFTYANKPA